VREAELRWEVEEGDADEKRRDARRVLRMQLLEGHRWHLEGSPANLPTNGPQAKYWIQDRFSAGHQLVSAVLDEIHRNEISNEVLTTPME
jgi:hypothetical protein